MSELDKSDESNSLVFFNKNNASYYGRSYHKDQEILTQMILDRYQMKWAVLTSSGMSAISTLLTNILTWNQFIKFNIVCSYEMYCDTHRLVKYYKEEWGNVRIYFVNVYEKDHIEKLFTSTLKDQNNILLIESCSNPNGYIMDYSSIPLLRDSSNKFYFINDNTWLTDYIFKMQFPAVNYYYVVSLTKYYSAGMAIAGAIVSNDDDLMPKIIDYNRIHGHHISPYNCRIIIKNTLTMNERLTNSYLLTKKLVAYFRSHPKIAEVSYPYVIDGDNNHMSYQLALKYFENGIGPSVFTCKIRVPKHQLVEIFKNNKWIDYQTSYGGKRTRIDTFPHTDGEYVIFRVASGYMDDYDRVVDGFNRILSRVKI